MNDPRVGVTVVHRRYVSHSDAQYGGGLVAGGFLLGLVGDAATEVCIRTDGDEGLFASYSDVQFCGPVMAGDVVEVEASVSRVGRRSRDLECEVRVVARSRPEKSPSAAQVLDSPLVVLTARGTVVVPDVIKEA